MLQGTHMDLSLDMNVEQQTRVSPTLIAVNHILALSSQELQTLIKQEAEENPAFEITEHQTCSICAEQLRHGVSLRCARNTSTKDSAPDVSDDFNFSGLGYKEEGFSSGSNGSVE